MAIGERPIPLLKTDQNSLGIKIRTEVDNFSAEILRDKLRQLDDWVATCNRLGGRWVSTWCDDLALCSGVAAANNNSSREKEDDVRAAKVAQTEVNGCNMGFGVF